MIILAHLSDTHLDTGPVAHARAARVMDYVNRLTGITAVVVTGDIADHGLPAEYAEARALLDSVHPVAVAPGNHDVRGPFAEGLLDGGPLNHVHRFPGATLVMCDSSIPGEDAGLLDTDTLAWLDATLAETDGPTFVCFHHPPVELQSPFVDALMLRNPDDLAAVLSRHNHITAVLCGHAHTGAASIFAGLPLLVAPGVVSTLKLPFEPEGEQPPALAFHVLGNDQRLTTHFRPLP